MNKKILLIGLIITVITMSIGYALYSTSLKVKGTGSIDSNFNIEVTNINEDKKEGKAVSITNPTYTKTSASFNTKLSREKDSIEYKVEITNKGSIDGKIENIEITNPNELIKVETRGIDKGQIIKAGEVKEYIVRVYIPEGTKINQDVTSKIEVNTEIIQDDNQIFNEPHDGIEQNKLSIESTIEESDYTSIKATVNAKGNGLKYSYSLDGEAYTEASENNIYTFNNLTPGKRYTVYYKVEDIDGNYVTESKWIETKDITNSIIKVENEDKWTRSKKVTIEFPLEENAKYYYKIGNNEYIESTSNQELNIEENTVIYAKIEKEGNITEVSKEVTKIDNKNPELIINTSATTRSITLIAIATDDSGIEKYEYSINGGDYIDNGKYNNYTFDELTHNTEYTVKVRATDKVGNQIEKDIILKTLEIATPTFTEETEGIVKISYPAECNGIYTCTYVKDGGEEEPITKNPEEVMFGTSGTLIAKVTDGINYITSSTYTVERKNLYVSSSGNDTTGFGTKSKPYKTLNKAYDCASNKNASTIYVMNNITQTETALFDENKIVTLTSYSESGSINSVVRGSSFTNYLINETNGTLTFKNIKINGNEISTTVPMIKITSSAYIETGTLITKAKNTNTTSSAESPGAISVDGGTLTMNAGEISYNTAISRGGGIRVDSGNFIMNGGIISNNTAENNGGGIRTNYSTLTLNGGTISNNSSPYGGGIYIHGTATINGGTISSNVASVTAGGIYIHEDAKVTIKNGAISNNTADSGGGIRNYGQLEIKDTNISNNNSSTSGGGISVSLQGKLVMSGSSMLKNEATTGGAILFDGATLELSNNIIQNNISNNNGGGIEIWKGTNKINGTTIESNTAKNVGGGIHVTSGTTTFADTKIINNTALAGGGLRTTGDANVIINSITITGNTADLGGGMQIYSSSKITMNNGTINNNTANTGYTANIGFGSSTASFVDNKASYTSSQKKYFVASASNNNFVLDVTGAAIANGTNIQLYTKNTSANAQKWQILPYKVVNGVTDYIIRSQLNGTQYAWVRGNSSTSGTTVYTYEFHTSAGGFWRLTNQGSSYYQIKNINGLCLDIASGTIANGTNIQAYTCNNSNAQKWKFVETT